MHDGNFKSIKKFNKIIRKSGFGVKNTRKHFLLAFYTVDML